MREECLYFLGLRKAMAGKVAHVFAEETGCGGSWFCIYFGGAVIVDSPRETAITVRNLRKSGHTIVYSNPLIGGCYRGFNKEERRLLAELDAKLASWERYRGLSFEEADRLEHLRQKGIKQGDIWADDVELYTPEIQKRAAKLLGEMIGTSCLPQTEYCLHADGNPYVVGRSNIQKFAEHLKYFNGILSLRNAPSEEVKELSLAGRPFTDEELGQLIREGVEIEAE